MRPEHYTTGNLGELVDTLPVTATAPQKRVIYRLDLGDAPAGGEILLATADMQVTNDLGIVVSVVTHLVLADSPDSLAGTEICEAQGANVTPDIHHGVANRAGSITVAAGNSRRYVLLVAWAASTQATEGMTLRVDQDYGRLAVLRWR